MSKDEINELLLKKMIAGEDVSEQKEKEIDVKSRRKKDYSSTFLMINSLSERHGVYISMNNYLRVSAFIRLLGTKLTLGGFIDNILNVHFEQFGDEISKMIEQQISKLKP